MVWVWTGDMEVRVCVCVCVYICIIYLYLVQWVFFVLGARVAFFFNFLKILSVDFLISTPNKYS